MSQQLAKILGSLRGKVEDLAAQRDAARAECERLTDDIGRLASQLEECRRQLSDARMQVDFLTVATRIDNPDNLILARRRIQRLINKIDRCVSLLKDDAEIN